MHENVKIFSHELRFFKVTFVLVRIVNYDLEQPSLDLSVLRFYDIVLINYLVCQQVIKNIESK